MFSESEYINGWLVYGMGVIIGLWCWWYLMYKLPLKYLRPALFGAMTAMLVMPWPTSDGSAFLAPAWIIAGAEGVFEGVEAFWRAGIPMLIAVAAGTMMGVVLQILWLLVRGVPHENTESTSELNDQGQGAKIKAARLKAQALKAQQV
ncbi:hypothetical protein [Marinagarivorans algicola]|uniref:hypothetical protein n=2 Tax=Marinagarivorans algicola TaxID=1513270 RepID=UPI0006B631D6|nr:hypothetical protein [Marinagarivorans algicola]